VRLSTHLAPARCADQGKHATPHPTHYRTTHTDRLLQKQSPGVAKWSVRISLQRPEFSSGRYKQGRYLRRRFCREKDLDEVLQISNVFVNVSKGEVAKSNDLKKSFGTDDRSAIAREVHIGFLRSCHSSFLGQPQLADECFFFFSCNTQILSKGEVQVGEKEREHDIAALRREIATLVAEKCVDPATQTSYSVSIIEKAMAEAGYSMRANKNAKSQVRPDPTIPCTLTLFFASRCPSVSRYSNPTLTFPLSVPKCGFASSSPRLILVVCVGDSSRVWTSSSTRRKQERNGQG